MFYLCHHINYGDDDETKNNRDTKSCDNSIPIFPFTEPLGDRCLHYIVRHHSDEDGCCGNDSGEVTCLGSCRVSHIDSIDISETRDNRETIVGYLRRDSILVYDTEDREELDDDDEACELHRRNELEWTFVFFFFTFVVYGLRFFSTSSRIGIESISSKSCEHHECWNDDRSKNGWINDECNDDNSQEHDTRCEECCSDI